MRFDLKVWMLAAPLTFTACGPIGDPLADEQAVTAEAGDSADDVVDSAEQDVSCGPRVQYYPVRGRHNNGYDSTAGNSSQWTCGNAHSNSDFVPGDHLGNDIWAARGTPVVATTTGRLVSTGYSSYSAVAAVGS